jgi:hypothetical protein
MVDYPNEREALVRFAGKVESIKQNPYRDDPNSEVIEAYHEALKEADIQNVSAYIEE